VKIAEYNQMMKYLTRPARSEPEYEQVAMAGAFKGGKKLIEKLLKKGDIKKGEAPKTDVEKVQSKVESDQKSIQKLSDNNQIPVKDQTVKSPYKFTGDETLDDPGMFDDIFNKMYPDYSEGGKYELPLPGEEPLTKKKRTLNAEGGVIGEDGMFVGEDLESRTGFAEIKTKNVLKAPDLVKLLEKYDINISPRNIGRGAEIYGIKRPENVTVEYKDRNSKRLVDLEKPKSFYVKPTVSELNQIKKQYDINQLKAPGMTEAGKKEFKKRKAYVTKLLKTKKYTQAEVKRMAKEKFNKDMSSVVNEVAKTIKGIPSGTTGESAALVKKIKRDLKELNKSEVKKLLKNGDTNLEKLVKKTSKLLDINNDLATRRIGQLIEAYAGDDRYIKVKDDLFLRRVQPILKGLGQIEGTKLFGGLAGGLQRVRAERKVAKDLSKQSSFFPSLRKRIQELIPGSGYETDEIKNIKSSAKFGTSPYSVFIQGVQSNINQEKAATLDKQTSIYEKRLQNAKTITEKKEIANEFNKKAKAFAAEANKNLKPGQLPVRTLEISFNEPNKVIKNKSALANYGDMFDDIYKKHGYSFKVPSDVKTVDEVLPFLKSGRGQKQILRGVQTQAPRLFLQAIPGAESLADFTSSIIDDVAKGAYGRAALKKLGLIGTYFGGKDAVKTLAEGESGAEAVADFLGLKGIAQDAMETASLTPEGRDIKQRTAREQYQKNLQESGFMGGGLDQSGIASLYPTEPDQPVTEAEARQLQTEQDIYGSRKEGIEQLRRQAGDIQLQQFKSKFGIPYDLNREYAYGGRVEMKIGGDPKDKKKTTPALDKPTIQIDPNAPIDPGRRDFMEKGAGMGLGLGALATGLVKFGPEIKKAVTNVTTTIVDEVPNIINELYFTIRNLGKTTDYGRDGIVKTKLGNYELIEEPGGYSITKTTDSDFRYQQEYFEVTTDPEKGVIHYEELTALPDMDGKLKDVDYGVDLDTYREIGEDLAKIKKDDSLIKIADDDIAKQIEKEEAFKKSLQKKGTGEND
jgi:hypothetical protein